MKTIALTVALFFALALAAVAQQAPASHEEQASGMMPHQSHSAALPITYAELKNTVTQLERARPGTGVHFVQTLEPKGFDIEKPPILIYQKNPDAPGGYSLVGVVYLWNAAAGPDGQPLNPPFPKSLARWHRHTNLCMAPGLANPHGLTESQCREQGGRFIAEAPWMVHAWIWKDSPSGVFSDQNPALR